MASRACITKNCEEIVGPRSQFKVCSGCRGAQRRWFDKGSGAAIKRRLDLHRFDDRLNYVIKPKKRK